MTSGTGVFNPATDAAGTYTYTITNTCGTSSNTVVVSIIPLPNTGSNGVALVCANATAINLEDSLGGSPVTGGTWSPVMTSGTGVFDPLTDAAGPYTYTVTNSCGSSNNTVTVTISPLPNTGANGAISLCSTDPATDLFTQLGAGADVGGTWSPAMTSGTGVYDPATDPAGPYTYTITNSCGTSSDTVTVSISSNPIPGSNGVASVCSNAAAINLVDSLGGSPSAGGTWSPAMTSGTGVFDPATDAAGTYTYTVNDCSGNPQTADVIVTITSVPNTGSNGAVTFCPADPAADLFTQLGVGADVGGTWSPAMTSGTGVFDPATDAAGLYTYTITNSCGTSSDTVTVTISTNPSPGTNGVASICSNAAAINLVDSLGGTPSAGGTWSPAMTSGTGMFDPATDAATTYTYTVNDCSGSPLTATVIVTILASPNSGANGAITMCTTDAASDLFTQLGAGADVGGTWSPAMTSGTGVFDPATDAATTYTYTVTNSCGTSSNDVVVTVNVCTTPSSGYIVSDSTVCEGTCITITDQSTGGNTWEWTFNGGTPATSNVQNPGTVCFNTPGTYTIEQIVSNGFGADTTTSTVEVFSTPIIDAGQDVAVELGQSTTLNATGGGVNAVYTWNPADWLTCVICPTTIATPDETITYTVSVVDSNGCVATDDVTVIVNYDNVIWVANIFSPNGDGNNDVLFVRGKGVESFQFVVYDRWGEKVFETTDLSFGWDGRFRGKDMNKAVFVYYLKGFFIDGTEFNQKGDITLLR
jgi:gliding motility-associated-like protein